MKLEKKSHVPTSNVVNNAYPLDKTWIMYTLMFLQICHFSYKLLNTMYKIEHVICILLGFIRNQFQCTKCYTETFYYKNTQYVHTHSYPWAEPCKHDCTYFYQHGIMMDVYQKLIYHPNRCQSLKIKILKLAIVVAVCVLNRQDLGFFT